MGRLGCGLCFFLICALCVGVVYFRAKGDAEHKQEQREADMANWKWAQDLGANIDLEEFFKHEPFLQTSQSIEAKLRDRVCYIRLVVDDVTQIDKSECEVSGLWGTHKFLVRCDNQTALLVNKRYVDCRAVIRVSKVASRMESGETGGEMEFLELIQGELIGIKCN